MDKTRQYTRHTKEQRGQRLAEEIHAIKTRITNERYKISMSDSELFGVMISVSARPNKNGRLRSMALRWTKSWRELRTILTSS